MKFRWSLEIGRPTITLSAFLYFFPSSLSSLSLLPKNDPLVPCKSNDHIRDGPKKNWSISYQLTEEWGSHDCPILVLGDIVLFLICLLAFTILRTHTLLWLKKDSRRSGSSSDFSFVCSTFWCEASSLVLRICWKFLSLITFLEFSIFWNYILLYWNSELRTCQPKLIMAAYNIRVKSNACACAAMCCIWLCLFVCLLYGSGDQGCSNTQCNQKLFYDQSQTQSENRRRDHSETDRTSKLLREPDYIATGHKWASEYFVPGRKMANIFRFK